MRTVTFLCTITVLGTLLAVGFASLYSTFDMGVYTTQLPPGGVYYVISVRVYEPGIFQPGAVLVTVDLDRRVETIWLPTARFSPTEGAAADNTMTVRDGHPSFRLQPEIASIKSADEGSWGTAFAIAAGYLFAVVLVLAVGGNPKPARQVVKRIE